MRKQDKEYASGSECLRSACYCDHNDNANMLMFSGYSLLYVYQLSYVNMLTFLISIKQKVFGHKPQYWTISNLNLMMVPD